MGGEEVGVLGADGGDEVVDARHLDYGEEGDEDEPGRFDLLPCGKAVQGAPDAGDAFFALVGLVLGGGSVFASAPEEGGYFVDNGFAMVATLVADVGQVVFVGDVGVAGGVDIVCGVFCMGDEFAHGFVRVLGHEGELDDGDGKRDKEVDEEESLGGEGLVGGVVDQAVE